jgi:beta-N-acetylhexosaminidase
MRARGALAAVAVAILLGACTSSKSGTPVSEPASSSPLSSAITSSAPDTTLPTTSSAPPSSSSPPAPVLDHAHRLLAAMSEAQRVGQLFMVDCPTSQILPATVQAIQLDHVGSVILDRTSYRPASEIAMLTNQLELSNPSAAKLFIATDQEGGQVQRLRGPGFTQIPSAVQQGLMSPAALQDAAQSWGSQLRRAGVTVNLAPVLDTVPPDSPGNPPIGDLDREYGHDPSTVTTHGRAVLRGLAQAGVDATVKHFPGLGRVTGNTDLTSGVTDTVTTRHDPYLAPFAAAIAAHVPFVMMSTAIYARIDPGIPAAFSHTIVTGMLRDDLHFHGVIISDDLGGAVQVGGYPLGTRAVDFIAAGGDMVLTVDATQAAAMTGAVLQRVRASTHFRSLVDAAALRVLEAKDAHGLLD